MFKRIFSFGFITWLAILGLAAGLAWQLFYSDKSESRQMRNLIETTEQQQQALTQISDILNTYDKQFQQVAEHSNQIVTSVKELDSIVRGDSRTWRLMQVQNFLEMAMVQATLLNDTTAAINLLAAAENGLKSIDNPNLIPVRKALQGDIAMLANHPISNISNIILQIDGIVDHVPTLAHKIKLHQEIEATTPATTSGEKWEQRAEAAWQEVKSLVRIQRHDEPVIPYFSQDDIWLINENLILMLEQASFAAAHHYSNLYKQELKHAQDWIKKYFDLNDPAVQQVASALENLAQLPITSNSSLHLNTVDAWSKFVASTQAGRQ